MERALASAGVSVIVQNDDLQIQFFQNLPDHLSDIARIGFNDLSLFGE
jgi:hypothetical protein